MKRNARLERGFTLVELMIVVAIIGILASIAVPGFNKAVLRAKAVERATTMDAIGRGVNDLITSRNGLPNGAVVWEGTNNPPGAEPPGAQKRLASMTAAGWENLPVILQGGLYYTYSFLVTDPGGKGTDVNMDVIAVGDLDADGFQSAKVVTWKANGYALYRDAEVPAAGQEDLATF